MVPAGRRGVIHLTLTDDYPYAQAFVIIEAVEDDVQLTGDALAPGDASV
jgi:holo-[acyl-carrier protein] synthase